MTILLTLEEIKNIITDTLDKTPSANLRGIVICVASQDQAKAQAKKIAEWGEEECDNPQHRAEYAIRAETAYYSQRRECEYCWHELEQEIKK